MSYDPADYTCAITAKAVRRDQLIQDASDDDPFEGAPLHLLRITIGRRTPNPAYAAMVNAREAQIEAVYRQSYASAQANGISLDPATDEGQRALGELRSLAEGSVDIMGARKHIGEESPYDFDDPLVLYVDPNASRQTWQDILKALGIEDGDL